MSEGVKEHVSKEGECYERKGGVEGGRQSD